MAFICTANNPGRYSVMPIVREGRCDVSVQVGFDPDNPSGPSTFYSTIHTYPNPVAGMIEFGFGFLGVNNLARLHFHTYVAATARSVVSPECLPHMRSLIVHYADLVVSATKPAQFMMETYETNLPEKALVKYVSLCDIFRALGYSITHSITAEQKDRWMMAI